MSEFEDPIKSPEIQEIVMSGMIGWVIDEIAERLGISPQRAFEEFYPSDTCRRLHNRETGLYLFSHKYIADEFILEMQSKY